MGNDDVSMAHPKLSIVIPVYDEAESIGGLLEETVRVVGDDPGAVEIIVVDDGSRDATPGILGAWLERCPVMRVLTFEENSGQSAAMACGFASAKGDRVVAMDGDGQSDPADIPRLAKLLNSHDVVCGIRRHRRDGFGKRIGSKWANMVRRRITGDRIEDIGCSLKAFHREPLQRVRHFNGSHRFLPLLVELEGCTDLIQVEVNHRPRVGGVSKYTNLGRLLHTWQDLLAIRWYQKRFLRFQLKDES
jgi:dolichol-phosphate mannosyltransferase